MKPMVVNSREHLLDMMTEKICTVSGQDCSSGRCYLHAICNMNRMSDTYYYNSREIYYQFEYYSKRKQAAIDAYITIYGEAGLFEVLL